MRGFGSAVGAMVAAILWAASAGSALADVPNLVGAWSGKNDTIGDVFGLRSRDRTVHITEQTDRRFRGYFTYEDGRKDFFGIIFPDDVTFAWVSATSKGEVHGRIMAPDHIAACYVEGGAEATAGCSDLKRTGEKAQ